MRNLSSTLLLAQKASTYSPYIQLEVKNQMTDVTRLKWERLYEGTENEYYHGLCVADDGSLIRVRITPPVDGCKLYFQRAVNPGEQSDFSTWNYTGKYNCLAVATAAYSSEVSIFWINTNQELWRMKSSNYGADWDSSELLDYSSSIDVNGMNASYKTGGDIALFFIDQAALYIKKCVSGSWQLKSAWNKTTGELTSIATFYQADWNLLITGQDTAGNYKVWSLTYGDGGDVPAGSWSSIKEIASAPAGNYYEFCGVFLDKPDVYRAFFSEKFIGVQNYTRPLFMHSVPDTAFTDNLWHEPVPFNYSCEYGMALAHHSGYCWLSTANGVWRAELSSESLDITNDVLALKYDISGEMGRLMVELRNDDGRYKYPGKDNLTVLNFGGQIEVSPGYCTSQGNETSPGLAFWLNGWEHINSAGKSKLVLHGVDGWSLLANWKARHQFRWNKDGNEMSVKQIIETVAARAGLKLQVKSRSSSISSFYPDFTIQPGENGMTVINRLLSFVPDLLFIEGVKAYLVYPQSSDASEYSYGQTHVILQGRYHANSWHINQVHIEGFDDINKQPIIVDSFSWEQMEHFYDRTIQIEDRNIASVSDGQARGEAYLRKAEIESFKNTLLIPVNCGQQIYDVIDITDKQAGLISETRRVREIALIYLPEKGQYMQNLLLGGV
jgi:hypothetical protein